MNPIIEHILATIGSITLIGCVAFSALLACAPLFEPRWRKCGCCGDYCNDQGETAGELPHGTQLEKSIECCDDCKTFYRIEAKKNAAGITVFDKPIFTDEQIISSVNA